MKILSLLAVVCVNAVVINPMLETFKEGYSNSYNSLPKAEQADEALKISGKFSEFTKEFAALLDQHKLEDQIGLRLLHNHFNLSDGQVMTEFFGDFKGVHSSITRPMNADTAQAKEAVAASWMFADDGALVPFEFSVDSYVKDARKALETSSDFMKQAYELVGSYGYTKFLALAILKKDAFPLPEGKKLLENSYDKFGSVIQAVEAEEVNKSKMVTTSWDFSREVRDVICIPSSYCKWDGEDHLVIPDHDSMVIED